MFNKYKYDGTRRFNIRRSDRAETSLCLSKKEARKLMDANFKEIDELHEKLYADKKEGVIFLFQAMDAAGKDGTIKSVLQCLSPHGVHEVAFKAPSSEELAHDFLWRIEKNVPAKGDIAIFNRSQYEELLIWRVKELFRVQANSRRIDQTKMLQYRFEDIRNYERYLYHNNVRTVKIFLNVSKEEQARRFLSRIEDPEKNWKFSGSDFEERQYWDEYQKAFEDIINRTSTRECPWFVVPADNKWYMRYIVSEIVLATLRDMVPVYPEVTPERLETFNGYKEKILEEYPALAQEAAEKAAKKAAKEAAKIAKEFEKRNSETAEQSETTQDDQSAN